MREVPFADFDVDDIDIPAFLLPHPDEEEEREPPDPGVLLPPSGTGERRYRRRRRRRNSQRRTVGFVPTRVEQTDAAGNVNVLWNAGPGTLAPADVPRFLTARGEGNDLVRLARHQTFW